MSLRESLFYKPVTKEHRKKILTLARKILTTIDADGDASEGVRKMNELTGQPYDPYDEYYFATMYTWSDVRVFVESACGGEPVRVMDLEKEELIDIVRRALRANGSELAYYCKLLDRNVPMIRASGLVASAKLLAEAAAEGDNDARSPMTPEQIIEIATDTEKHVIAL